ncbi:MAG TPA: LapA family protein [Steroidobacteraceae bacterium]|nr:LapA family protein [Steroidobacteraceae bacterium]
MRPRNVAYIIVLLLLLGFLLANWNAIATSSDLNLFVARIHAPFGVLILLVATVIGAVGFVAHALARYGWQRERNRLTQQIEELRLRADQSQESHLGALHALIERETATIRSQLERVLASLPKR